MRDSIQLDQYVFQPLVKGSNSQVSILTLDPDSPPFQNQSAQLNYFDDSLDDLKNEIDFFSIDSGDHQKNFINYNLSAMNTSTGSYFNKSTNYANQINKNNQQYNQNLHPLLLVNSRSDIYPPNQNQNLNFNLNSNNLQTDPNNFTNSPQIQNNYVNNNHQNISQNINSSCQLFALPPQLIQQDSNLQKCEKNTKNNQHSINSNQIKYTQTYPINNQIPQFQKSNSAAFPSAQYSQSRQLQQQFIQEKQNIYLQQQLSQQNQQQLPPQQLLQQQQQQLPNQQKQQSLNFCQQDDSFIFQQSPLNKSQQFSGSQFFTSPQLIPYQNIQNQNQGSIAVLNSCGSFLQINDQPQSLQYQNIQNQSKCGQNPQHSNTPQTPQQQQQQQQQLNNFYQSQQNQFNYFPQNQQYIYQHLQQQNLNLQQQSMHQLKLNQQLSQNPKNQNPIYENQIPSNFTYNQFIQNIPNNNNNNQPEQLTYQNSQLSTPKLSNLQNNHIFSPFSTCNDDDFFQQIENELNQNILSPEISENQQKCQKQKNNNNTNNFYNQQHSQQQQQQDQFRQKNISFQHSKNQPDLKLKKAQSQQYNNNTIKQQQQKNSNSNKEAYEKGKNNSSQSSLNPDQIKKCIDKNCNGAQYAQYQPTSPNNSYINNHKTLVIKQITHHEQNQHDKNCYNMYNEYTIQSNLNHEYILKPIQMQLIKNVHDHPNTKGGCYIIYPRAQSDLYDYYLSQSTSHTNIEEIRLMMQQISSSLQYIHEEKNIVHCDIKPENIFKLAKDHFVLADFGLAHYVLNLSQKQHLESINSKEDQKQKKIQQILNNNLTLSSENLEQISNQKQKSAIQNQNNFSLFNEDQVKQEETTDSKSIKVSNLINNQIIDHNQENSEFITFDLSSKEKAQQTSDSQSQSSSFSGSSTSFVILSQNSSEQKVKSCFHCYPHNLPDYVYANIYSQQAQNQRREESEEIITQDCDEDSELHEQSSFQEVYENPDSKEDFDQDSQKKHQNKKQNDNKQDSNLLKRNFQGQADNSNDDLFCIHLCDQFSYKSRQSDYFSPEIIKYQTFVQNGVSKKEISKNGIDQIDEKKADVFALGMTLFVCLFKTYPYSQKCSVEDSLFKYFFSPEKKVREQFWSKFVLTLEHYANQFDDSRVHELKDLLEKMLNPNPDQRISINEVVSHQWLAKSQ